MRGEAVHRMPRFCPVLILRAVPAAPGFVEGDEAQNGEERHLESGLDCGLGFEHQHDHRRDGEIAGGQRRAVDQHGEEDHRDHDEGALGGDP